MDRRTRKQRMFAGDLYTADDPELAADAAAIAAWMDRYNARQSRNPAERLALLREAFGHAGDGATIRPPFTCDYGYNIHLGAGAFLNFGCTILDVVAVTIGAGTQIGPGVQLLTADHPRDPAARAALLEFGRPVAIGRNVWIGGGAIVLPGVTVGDDAIVGAGAVVTRDVPAGATVAGNPARSLRWMDRPALEAAWLHLTRVELPALAAARHWPVRADHCFQRILLDHAHGGRWYDHIAGRPAYAHATAEALARAVALGRATIAGQADMAALNRASLGWRGKG